MQGDTYVPFCKGISRDARWGMFVSMSPIKGRGNTVVVKVRRMCIYSSSESKEDVHIQ